MSPPAEPGVYLNEINVFNLVCKNTIEEHVLDLLAKKLRMFELVIGELAEVLGLMSGNGSFESQVARAWLAESQTENGLPVWEQLAHLAAAARQRYDEALRSNLQLNRA